MASPIDTLPSSLRANTTITRLGPDVPALVTIPPETETPVGALLWMHGRTAFKELDNGRYLRLMRAGIASVALDLPGHGERSEPGRDRHTVTPGVIAQMHEELPEVLADLRSNHARIDSDRLIIGGMSAGGMVAARACFDSKSTFRGLIMESSTGWLRKLYDSDIRTPDGYEGKVEHTGDTASLVEHIDTMHQVNQAPELWPTLPMLALHSQTDQTVPIDCQAGFIDRLKAIYQDRGEAPGLITLHTWPETGAPYEHAGFGKVASKAKGLVTEFCSKHTSQDV